MSIPAIIMRRYFVEKKEKLARRECSKRSRIYLWFVSPTVQKLMKTEFWEVNRGRGKRI